MELFINERLTKWLEYKKISQAELSRKLIIKERSQVNQWCKLKAPIPPNYIIDIIRIFSDLDARWFITGDGEMLDAETYKSHIDIPYTNEPIPPYSGKIKICRDPVCIAEREILKEQIDKLKDKIYELNKKYDELRKQEGGAQPGKRDVGGMDQSRPTGTDG